MAKIERKQLNVLSTRNGDEVFTMVYIPSVSIQHEKDIADFIARVQIATIESINSIVPYLGNDHYVNVSSLLYRHSELMEGD